MSEPIRLVLPQTSDYYTQGVRRTGYAYRYASMRSSESRDAGDAGQDYLTLWEHGDRVAFAICDGVGQSFLGDLGAQLLGDALVAWLWHDTNRPEVFPVALAAMLHELTLPASAAVSAAMMPTNTAPLLMQVLEQKRALGSEATFVCGWVDLAANEVRLAWMGDTRLRLWRGREECSQLLGEHFHTAERWSSRRGLVGNLHSWIGQLATISRIACYTDGLAILDQQRMPIAAQALNLLLDSAGAQAANDDRIILEIVFQRTVPKTWLNPGGSLQTLPTPVPMLSESVLPATATTIGAAQAGAIATLAHAQSILVPPLRMPQVPPLHLKSRHIRLPAQPSLVQGMDSRLARIGGRVIGIGLTTIATFWIAANIVGAVALLIAKLMGNEQATPSPHLPPSTTIIVPIATTALPVVHTASPTATATATRTPTMPTQTAMPTQIATPTQPLPPLIPIQPAPQEPPIEQEPPTEVIEIPTETPTPTESTEISTETPTPSPTATVIPETPTVTAIPETPTATQPTQATATPIPEPTMMSTATPTLTPTLGVLLPTILPTLTLLPVRP